MTKTRLTRIYKVAVEGQSDRLVQATSASQAIRFVAEPMIMATIPTPEQLLKLGARGVELEDANKEAE